MRELARILSELWAERSRVGLVALGVLWGTLGLGILLSFGSSMNAASSETADNFGVALLRVGGAATTRPFQGLPAGRSLGLEPEDALALATVPGVRAVCYEFSRGASVPLQVGDLRRNVPLAGVSPGFEDLRRRVAMPGGRYVNQRDFEQHRRVCFLGGRLAREIFGDGDPVGRTVELMGTPLVVVGAGPERVAMSNYNGEDRDKLNLPGTTFQDLMGWRYISHAWVGLAPGADAQRVLAGVRRTLGARLHFDPDDEPALDIQNYVQIREMIDGILAGNRIFTLVVGVLGLLVSVVGVANVMLTLVEERTQELGVQLALGARPRLLAAERLVEGVAVTTVGGLAGLVVCAGVLAGLGLAPLPMEVHAYLGHPRLDLGLGVGVLAVLVVAGAFAGWVPARRAMQLDPVQILRDE